jgi:hypothetical protein
LRLRARRADQKTSEKKQETAHVAIDPMIHGSFPDGLSSGSGVGIAGL